MTLTAFLAAAGGDQNMLRIALILALIVLPFVAAFAFVKGLQRRHRKGEARALSDLTGTSLGAHLGADVSHNDGWLQSALDTEEADDSRQHWQSALLEDQPTADLAEAPVVEKGARRRLSLPFRKSAEVADVEEVEEVAAPQAPEAAVVYRPEPVAAPVAAPVAPVLPEVPVAPVRVDPPVMPVPVSANRPGPLAPVLPPVPVAASLTPPPPAASPAPTRAAEPVGAISFGAPEVTTGPDGWGESGGSDDATTTWWDSAVQDDQS